MTDVDFLLDRFEAAAPADAMVWRGRVFSYRALREAVQRASATLDEYGIGEGTVVSLEADFGPAAVAMLLALIARRCVVVPLTASVEASKPRFREIAEVEAVVEVTPDDAPAVRQTGVKAGHPLVARLRELHHPGLVIFSSGSTGASKAALHDFVPLLEQFHEPRRAQRAITFLLFDHIGGVNTLFSILACGGCVVTVDDRSPDAVCRAIERHRVELLPTSPTFLNLLLLSEACRRHDLSSLRVVSYGTEVMPESTLLRLRDALPNVKVVQKYGLSELGILTSKTRASDALWVKIGGEGCETRVVNGMLEVRAPSAMLGYLNAPSPFTPDGWFPTGDGVEVDGEYVRILGRRSEIINIGGEKVYPAEIEGVLQVMDGVLDVAVVGEPHPIAGHIATARVRLATAETLDEFRQRMRRFCRDKLPRYKTPQKVEIVSGDLHVPRFKKLRTAVGPAGAASERHPEGEVAS